MIAGRIVASPAVVRRRSSSRRPVATAAAPSCIAAARCTVTRWPQRRHAPRRPAGGIGAVFPYPTAHAVGSGGLRRARARPANPGDVACAAREGHLAADVHVEDNRATPARRKVDSVRSGGPGVPRRRLTECPDTEWYRTRYRSASQGPICRARSPRRGPPSRSCPRAEHRIPSGAAGHPPSGRAGFAWAAPGALSGSDHHAVVLVRKIARWAPPGPTLVPPPSSPQCGPRPTTSRRPAGSPARRCR